MLSNAGGCAVQLGTNSPHWRVEWGTAPCIRQYTIWFCVYLHFALQFPWYLPYLPLLSGPRVGGFHGIRPIHLHCRRWEESNDTEIVATLYALLLMLLFANAVLFFTEVWACNILRKSAKALQLIWYFSIFKDYVPVKCQSAGVRTKTY